MQSKIAHCAAKKPIGKHYETIITMVLSKRTFQNWKLYWRNAKVTKIECDNWQCNWDTLTFNVVESLTEILTLHTILNDSWLFHFESHQKNCISIWLIQYMQSGWRKLNNYISIFLKYNVMNLNVKRNRICIYI